VTQFNGVTFRFWGPGREGIAVDGSRDNRISNNWIAENSAGGVFLYTNCGEYVHSDPTNWVEHRFGADDNTITGNLIAGGRAGVWVGSRMAENVYPMDCSDVPYVSGPVQAITLDRARFGSFRLPDFRLPSFATSHGGWECMAARLSGLPIHGEVYLDQDETSIPDADVTALVQSSPGGDEVRPSGRANARPRQFQLNKPVIGWMRGQRSAVVIDRWNYGADRLRERPARRRSEAELVPTWRELQPILIRSACVIGLAVTIMGVIVSDARRFGGDVALVNRSDRAEYPASGEAPPAPPVATTGAMVDELHAEAAQPVQASKDRLPEAVPEANVVEPPMPVAVVPVDDLQREAQAAPTGFAAPVNTASVSASAGMLAGTPPGAAETVAAVFASTPVGAPEPAAANPSLW